MPFIPQEIPEGDFLEEMGEEFEEFRDDMKDDMASIKNDMKGKFDSFKDDMKGKFDDIKDQLSESTKEKPPSPFLTITDRDLLVFQWTLMFVSINFTVLFGFFKQKLQAKTRKFRKKLKQKF